MNAPFWWQRPTQVSKQLQHYSRLTPHLLHICQSLLTDGRGTTTITHSCHMKQSIEAHHEVIKSLTSAIISLHLVDRLSLSTLSSVSSCSHLSWNLFRTSSIHSIHHFHFIIIHHFHSLPQSSPITGFTFKHLLCNSVTNVCLVNKQFSLKSNVWLSEYIHTKP